MEFDFFFRLIIGYNDENMNIMRWGVVIYQIVLKYKYLNFNYHTFKNIKPIAINAKRIIVKICQRNAQESKFGCMF